MTTQQPEALAQECADYATSLRSGANVANLKGRAPSVSFLRAADLFERAASRITELESQLAQRFDAADVATASAQGFRDGAAKEQQAGWQPIETAPANGQCLVWCDTDDGGEVMKLCRDKKGNWLYEGEPTYATGFYIEPTHWRELPPPPSSAQREVGNANS